MFRAFILALAFLAVHSRVASAQPAGGQVAHVSFLNASSGIVVYLTPPQNVYKFTSDGQTLLPGLNGARAVTVQDSDVAWCVVGRNLYRGDRQWTHWYFVDSNYEHSIIGTAAGQLFFVSNGSLYSATASGIFADTGTEGDVIHDIDYLNPNSIFLLGDTAIYRSTDGGHFWRSIYGTRAAGLFADRYHHKLYIGGPLRVSTNDGTSWQDFPSESQYPFVPLPGRVYGSHDCTGTFYVSSSGNVIDVFRYGSDDFFHDIGTLRLSPSTRIFDGGAILYDLEHNYASFTGADGSLTDSASAQVVISCDTPNVNLCSRSVDSVHLMVAPLSCLPISIDSVTIAYFGSAMTTAVKRIISGTTLTVALPYDPHIAGTDTVRLRVWVHSVEGRAYREHTDVLTIARITGAPAALRARPSLDFGLVHVDSTRTLTFTIGNNGCDPLRIDSIVSTNPLLFGLSTTDFPSYLAWTDSLSIQVTYRPSSSGKDLESLEIGTNAGHRFITLTGSATPVAAVAEDSSEPTVLSEMNGSLRVACSTAGRISVMDLLGRTLDTWEVEPGISYHSMPSLPRGVYLVLPSFGSARLVVVP